MLINLSNVRLNSAFPKLRCLNNLCSDFSTTTETTRMRTDPDFPVEVSRPEVEKTSEDFRGLPDDVSWFSFTWVSLSSAAQDWVTFFGTRFCFCSTLNLYWILIFLPNLILLSLFCLEPMTSRLLGVCPAAELQQPRPVGFLKCSSLVSTNVSP